ncbi:MAG: ribosomal L7Ae/L30e/S12e/Gadd45 family protein [Clostridia bacterium]|nr:ribosomal L7Ae/L30e/S12e/Gadd45 family protein [Clostridia bacterium]
MSELEKRLMSAIGLCMKAGKLASGEFAAEKALKTGGRLALVDENASDNTKKQWRDACEFRSVPILFVRELGAAIGKSARMCAVVTDGGFARMIASAAQKLREERDGGAGCTGCENEETDKSEKQNVYHTEAETND